MVVAVRFVSRQGYRGPWTGSSQLQLAPDYLPFVFSNLPTTAGDIPWPFLAIDN